MSADTIDNTTDNTPAHCHGCGSLPHCHQAQNMGANTSPVAGWVDDCDIYCADCLDASGPREEWESTCTPYDGESDSPTHCSGCGVPIEHELTTDGVDYVREAISEGAGCCRELWPTVWADYDIAPRPTVSASFLYSGYADYFKGYSCADEDGNTEHLLYATYCKDTTLHDIIDELVEDSWNGPASETIPEGVTQDDVRRALLDTMLNSRGRDAYEKNELAECSEALEYDWKCPDCGEDVISPDCDNCGHCHDLGESPVFIVVLDCVEWSPVEV